MPCSALSYVLIHLDVCERKWFSILLQCAPFLKGMRPVCAVNVEDRYLQEFLGFFRETDIGHRILAVCSGRCLTMLYWKEAFGQYILQDEVQNFLALSGYKKGNLDAMLGTLSERIACSIKYGNGFPHEMGAFLGYPLQDVTDFIRHDGKRYLLSGYWKVYHDPVKAELTFLAYDKARISLANELLSGRTVREIIRNTWSGYYGSNMI